MSIKNFSAYSLDAGALGIEDILNQEFTKKTNVAFLTDNNTLIGVPAFFEKASERGVTPIIGVNVGVEEHGGIAGDITLYAKNKNGLKNLQKIVSASEKNKNKDKYVDISHILNNSSDLVALIGGHNSILQKALSVGRDDYAKKNLYELKKCFGENLYFEIQKTQVENSDEINKQIVKLSKEFNSPLLATNNNRMRGKANHIGFIEKAIKIKGVSNKSNVNLKDTYLATDFIKTEEQVISEFPEYVNDFTPVKSMINQFEKYSIFHDLPEIPEFPGITDDNYFYTVLREKYNEFLRTIPKEKHPEYHERIKYETDLVKELGFEKYFVLFIQIEKNKIEDQKFNVRGSAVSFLITHVLGLSDVDPVENKLLAERFLNRNRLIRHELPDIDIESNNIEASYAFLAKTFGVKNTAYLSSNSVPKAKGQIQLAMDSLKTDIEANPLDAKGNPRVYPKAEVDLLLKYVGSIWGHDDMTLAAMVKENAFISRKNANWVFDWKHDFSQFNTKDFKNKFYKINSLEKLANEYPNIKNIIGYARTFDSTITSNGISYGSAVVSNQPISDFFSTHFVDGNYDSGEKAVKIALEATKKHAEKLGLVKLDILSNRYLDKLANAEKAIPEFDLKSKKYDDPEVYKMFSRGFTATINQIKSKAQREASKNIGVNNFNELVALLSLIRPAVKKDQEVYIKNKNNPNLSFSSETMKDIFAETYGVLVFEEQIMEMAQKIAGYSREESDDFRSLIKKVGNNKNKDKDKNYFKLEKEKENFVTRARANNMPEEVVKECNEILNNLNGYAFSKAHSLSYSALTYKQAWIDARYPGEYIQHFLLDESGKNFTNDIEFGDYLDKTARFGRNFLGLDINRSENSFKTRKNNNGDIFIDPSFDFILKNEEMANLITLERQNGKFRDFFDFIERTHDSFIHGSKGFTYQASEAKEKQYKKFVNTLIDSGAFDSLAFNDLKNNDVLLSMDGNKEQMKCFVRTTLSTSLDQAVDVQNDPFFDGDYKFFISDILKNKQEIDEIEENAIGYSLSKMKKLKADENKIQEKQQATKKPVSNRSRNRP